MKGSHSVRTLPLTRRAASPHETRRSQARGDPLLSAALQRRGDSHGQADRETGAGV